MTNKQMSNKEKYKQAFSVLHASCDISLEVEKMERKAEQNKKVFRMRPVAAACVCVCLLFGSMATAYAADLGGIREKLTTWIHGEQVDVDVTENGDGSYNFSYQDGDDVKEFGGGGVSLDADGKQSPLSAEEVLDEAGDEVVTEKDGTVWLYYRQHKVNITELVKGDKTCKVAITDKDGPVYFDIKFNGSSGYEIGRSDKPIGSKYSYKVMDETRD